MKPIWLVENFSDSDDYRDLVAAIKNNGNKCILSDKKNHFDPDFSEIKENSCIVAQGSIQFIKSLKEKLPAGCFPISYSTFENYYCSTYYYNLKQFLFNRDYLITTVNHLKEHKFDFYQRFGKEALIFIRPDDGEKSFTGQLLDLQDFNKFWTGLGKDLGDNDTIIISSPKKIIGEWRFICSKYNSGEIIAVSTYQYQGQKTLIPSAPAKATELVKNILETKHFPDSVFCLDICQDLDGNFWLLELTSFSSAGLYAANKNQIVQRVSEIAAAELENLKNLSSAELNSTESVFRADFFKS